MSNSYEFDPCTIDGSDEVKGEITLDNWKPSPKKNVIVQAQWRKEQIGDNFNQEPGIDEITKINMYLKKKKPDSEIMRVFGINAETLVAIKKGLYCPVEGIALDNLSKIHAEFNRLNNALTKVRRGIEYLAETLFIDKKDLQDFKNYCDKKMKEKPVKEKDPMFEDDKEE